MSSEPAWDFESHQGPREGLGFKLVLAKALAVVITRISHLIRRLSVNPNLPGQAILVNFTLDYSL